MIIMSKNYGVLVHTHTSTKWKAGKTSFEKAFLNSSITAEAAAAAAVIINGKQLV